MVLRRKTLSANFSIGDALSVSANTSSIKFGTDINVSNVEVSTTITTGSDTLTTVNVPPAGFNLWRLYSYNNSSGGLWDTENATGVILADDTNVTSGLTLKAEAVPTVDSYGMYKTAAQNPFSDNATASADGWNDSGGGFWSGGRIYNQPDAIGNWVYWWTTDAISMEGAEINLRTFTASRATRSPRGMYLQYYDGTLGSNYDVNNWTTFATLTNTAQNIGNPWWRNITEGGTIEASS